MNLEELKLEDLLTKESITEIDLIHLVNKTKDTKLIENLFQLDLVQKSFKKESNDINYNVVAAIATHHLTSRDILTTLIQKSDSYIKTLIAMRDDCDALMQEKLFDDGDKQALVSLSYKKDLDRKIASALLKEDNFAKSIAKHIRLDDTIFSLLLDKYRIELAKNESLSHTMQEKLISFHEEVTKLALASNNHIDDDIISELIAEGSEDIYYAIYQNRNTPVDKLEKAYENKLNHYALANNEKTPKHILLRLQDSDDLRVLKSLAKNPATPIEVLRTLLQDDKFKEDVKNNESFL